MKRPEVESKVLTKVTMKDKRMALTMVEATGKSEAARLVRELVAELELQWGGRWDCSK